MKPFFVLLLFSCFAVAQEKHLAKVQKVNGTEVYILCEPTRPYEVVMGKNNSLQWGSFITAGLINESIATKVSKFVNGVRKKAADESIPFDAIIYTNGKNVSAIRFMEPASPDNDRIAEVQKINGTPVFIMNEPLMPYTVTSDKGSGIKWKSMLTAGIVNNSIEDDVSKYVNRLERDFRKNVISAVMYNNGKTALGIKF